MAKRRKRYRKPRHQMKPLFDKKGRPSAEKPLNRGEIDHLKWEDRNTGRAFPHVGPNDLNKTERTVHSGGYIHPPHEDIGYIRPPSKLRPEIWVPTRFPGITPGRLEADASKKKQLAMELQFRFLFRGQDKQVRLVFRAGGKECMIVETNSLVGYRKESIVYTSLQTAQTMYELGKVSWVETTRVSLVKTGGS